MRVSSIVIIAFFYMSYVKLVSSYYYFIFVKTNFYNSFCYILCKYYTCDFKIYLEYYLRLVRIGRLWILLVILSRGETLGFGW